MKKFLFTVALLLVGSLTWAQGYRPPQIPPAPYPSTYYTLTKNLFEVEPLEGNIKFGMCTDRTGNFYGPYVGGTPPTTCPYNGAPAYFNNSWYWGGLDIDKDSFYLFVKRPMTDGNMDGVDNNGNGNVDEASEQWSPETSIEGGMGDFNNTLAIVTKRLGSGGTPRDYSRIDMDAGGGGGINGMKLKVDNGSTAPNNSYQQLYFNQGVASLLLENSQLSNTRVGKLNFDLINAQSKMDLKITSEAGAGGAYVQMYGRTSNVANAPSDVYLHAVGEAGNQAGLEISAGASGGASYNYARLVQAGGLKSFTVDSDGFKFSNEVLDEAAPTCTTSSVGRVRFVKQTGANPTLFQICGVNGAGVYSWKDIVTWP